MSSVSSGVDPLDDLADEFLDRCRRGERPLLTEYTERYPELAERIRSVFPALLIMEEIGSGESQANLLDVDQTGSGATMPQRLGDYLLLRPIGSGGMGMVYEAIQESLGRHVALKTLPFHHLGDATRLERFRREARAAARLHHTHIVPVFGVGEHEGLHYYTMQFIRGHGLDTVLQEVKRLRHDRAAPSAAAVPVGRHLPTTLAVSLGTGRLPVDEAAREGATGAIVSQAHPDPAPAPAATTSLSSPSSDRSEQSDQPDAQYLRSVARIGVQVAEALEYAHQQGILHRDIKPSNLLLDAQGEVWVTDFGLAKSQGSDELTRTGDIVGTLRYMAPERFNGWSDARSDVYALGATMYEMLTLRPAFEESDRIKLIEQVLHDSPPPIRQLDRRIPRDLETIVLKALAKEPGERYATAGQMAEDLRRFGAGRPILARRSSAFERSWRWSKRNPVVAGAASTVAAALVAVAVISTLYATKEATANREITGLAVQLKTSLAESNRLLAIRNFDRGQAAFEKGEIGPGMLWMIESLRAATEAGNLDWKNAALASLSAWRRQCVGLKGVFTHDSAITTVTFVPDSKTLVTGSVDKTARLWDAITCLPIGQPLEHGDTIIAVASSPDGKTVLTASKDHTARLWDSKSGLPRGMPLVHKDAVEAAAFSPDGKTCFTGSDDKTARLWDVATGRPSGKPLEHQGSVDAVAFSPDGKTLLTGSRDKLARLWDAASGLPIGHPLEHQDGVSAVSFSPDGKAVLVGSRDGAAWLWDVPKGEVVGQPLEHQDGVMAVSFSPDGRTIVTGGLDGTAKLWDTRSGQSIGKPLIHRVWVNAVTFSPDGKIVLTGNLDGTARQWDTASGIPIGPHLKHQDAVVAVAYSPDGSLILTGSKDGTARLWDAASGHPFGLTLNHPGHVTAVAFSSDGRTILTGCADKTARLWRVSNGQPIGAPLLHEGAVESVSFSSDDKTILTGSEDGTARLWDVASRLPIGQPMEHKEIIWSAAFSPDGKTILTGSWDNTARLWDAATGLPIGKPMRHQGFVSSVAFSPDGKSLLTGGTDKMARLWAAPVQLPDDLPWIAAWVRTSTGLDLNEKGSVRAIKNAEWRQSRERLSRLGGPPEAETVTLLDPILFGPLPTARARSWVERQHWAEAESAFDKAVRARPLSSSVYLERGVFFASREQPEKAAADFIRALDLVPYDRYWQSPRSNMILELARWDQAYAKLLEMRRNDGHFWIGRARYGALRRRWDQAAADYAQGIQSALPNSEEWFEHACLLLIVGDEEGYRTFVKRIEHQEGQTDDPFIAYILARCCILSSDPIVEPARVIRWAEQAVASATRPWYLQALGAAYYRAGDFVAAASTVEKANIAGWSGEGRATGKLVAAMAQQRLGHRLEAQALLDEVELWWKSVVAPTSDGAVTVPVTDWLFLHVLRREAEALIRGEPVFPANPFAQRHE